MNFLAHLFITRHHPHLAVGNFVADFVKGNQAFYKKRDIGLGIRLHRFIDSYTDQHVQVRKGTKRLRPSQQKYAPVVLDILYDYILIQNWDKFSSIKLQAFANAQYELLSAAHEIMPPKLQKRLPSMIENNWLIQYGNKEGLTWVLQKMDDRTKYPSQFTAAIEVLDNNYDKFNQEFLYFFPELLQAAQKFLNPS